MGNIKVLIADDEVEVVEIMAKRVRLAGYDVITANDGQAAWEKIQAESPDVVILDLTMPAMDGFQVLKHIRENPAAGKWQPVIIVSARGELDDMKKGFDLDADHYITKPCNMEDIIKGIELMVNLIPQRKTKTEIENDDGGA